MTGTSPLDARLSRFRSRSVAEDPFSLGEALTDAGRHDDAMEVLRTALRVKPHDANLLFLAGRVLFASGAFQEAQDSLVAAAKAEPRNKQIYRVLGEVLLKRGDPARAIKTFERALKLDPADATIRALADRATRLARLADADFGKSTPPPVGSGAAAHSAPTRQFESSANAGFFPDDDEPTQMTDGSEMRAAVNEVTTSAEARAKAARALPLPEPAEPPTNRVRRSSAPMPPSELQDLASVLEPVREPVKREAPRAKSAPVFADPPVAQPPRPAARQAAPAIDPLPSSSSSTESLDSGDLHSTSESWGRGDPAAFIEADEPLGATIGRAEDVDAVFETLKREGLFEPPNSNDPVDWSAASSREAAGTKIGRIIGIVWVVAVLGAGAGWFGWSQWVARKHAEASRLVALAEGDARLGEHRTLVDAERRLRIALHLHARDTKAPGVLLFAQAQRALEGGAFEAGFLRPALERARRTGSDPAMVKLSEALMATARGEAPEARSNLAEALKMAPNDARVQYISGRIEQRLGGADAEERLVNAVRLDPRLVAAVLAVAELRYRQGERAQAVAMVDGILGGKNEHLRAFLWKQYFTADEADPATLLSTIQSLAPRLKDFAAPTDLVLTELVRARALRRQGHHDKAGEAIDHALGANEPRLLILVGEEARALGRYERAQAAASQAVNAAPLNADYRAFLAQVQLQRHDGEHALVTLESMPRGDVRAILLRARAALIVGDGNALAASAAALDEHVTAHSTDIEARAMRVRIHLQLHGKEVARDMLETAQQLAREAPGHPLVTLALGEAALYADESTRARTAMEQLVVARPDDPDAHYLLGRTKAATGDVAGAEGSFRRALELAGSHNDARLALGDLLLNNGRAADADAAFQELAARSGMVQGASPATLGRVGRVHALIQLGRLPDAEVQLGGIRASDADSPRVAVAHARLALAQNHPGEAVAALQDAANAANPSVDTLVAYGDSLFAAAELEASGRAYENALRGDPNRVDAVIGKASVLLRTRKTKDAIALLEATRTRLASASAPSSVRAKVLTWLARAHLEETRPKKADIERLLREAAVFPAAPAETYFFLGEVADAAEGRAAYERYLTLAPNGEFAERARRALRR